MSDDLLNFVSSADHIVIVFDVDEEDLFLFHVGLKFAFCFTVLRITLRSNNPSSVILDDTYSIQNAYVGVAIRTADGI